MSSFCSAKATHIFSAKNIRILYIESAKIVNEMTLNELVKLTTLWTTGPWYTPNPPKCYILCEYIVGGLGDSVGYASDWWSGRRFDPYRVQQHSSLEIDYKIFSKDIFSLPLIQQGQLSVSCARICISTGETLRELRLPRKSMVSWTDWLDMALMGWLDHKTWIQNPTDECVMLYAVILKADSKF